MEVRRVVHHPQRFALLAQLEVELVPSAQHHRVHMLFKAAVRKFDLIM